MNLDAVIIPCGGGGLSSGISLAAKAGSPDTEIWIAEAPSISTTKRLGLGSRGACFERAGPQFNLRRPSQPGARSGDVRREPQDAYGGITVSDKETATAMRDAS